MPRKTCPACDAPGKAIKFITMKSLALDGVLESVLDGDLGGDLDSDLDGDLGGREQKDGFRYCPDPRCPVAWFHPETHHVIHKNQLKVRIGMKETEGPRPICYCFGHDAADLEADIRARGTSEIPASIASKCRQGLGRCEETNPQGSCCLGNINQVIQAALGQSDGMGGMGGMGGSRAAGAVPGAPVHPFSLVEDCDCHGTDADTCSTTETGTGTDTETDTGTDTCTVSDTQGDNHA